MKILIEVPVEIDGELTDQEAAKLVRHLRIGLPVMREQLQQEILNPQPRMSGSVCRFKFGRPEMRVAATE